MVLCYINMVHAVSISFEYINTTQYVALRTERLLDKSIYGYFQNKSVLYSFLGEKPLSNWQN
jgi:hypothetical protein